MVNTRVFEGFLRYSYSQHANACVINISDGQFTNPFCSIKCVVFFIIYLNKDASYRASVGSVDLGVSFCR